MCKVDGCDQKKKLRKGFCNRHYLQMRRLGYILDRTIYNPNEFYIEGNVCKIKLYNAKGVEVGEALIDSEDYEKVKDFKWHLNGDGSVSCLLLKKPLHHVILDFTFVNHSKQVDHKNWNRLDNRKKNLRICNNSQNGCNRGKPKNNTSGFKGVYWHTQREKWFAMIKKNYKSIHLGLFEDKKEAALAYNLAALRYHGEFAYINKI